MREHHAYRLPITLIYDAPLANGLRVSESPPLDLAASPEAGDTVNQILESRPPCEYFGRYWSDQILHGKPALDALEPDRVLEVAFEALIDRPREVLERIAEFFEIEAASDPAGWISRAAARVRGVPPLRAAELEDPEYARLVEACEPATRLMAAR
jgi:hypothetical protein